MEGRGKNQCELTRQRGRERACSGLREEHPQRLGGKLALWRTRRKGKVAGGWRAKGRGWWRQERQEPPPTGLWTSCSQWGNKSNVLFKMKEILPLVTTRMDLEDFVLREVSWTHSM